MERGGRIRRKWEATPLRGEVKRTILLSWDTAVSAPTTPPASDFAMLPASSSAGDLIGWRAMVVTAPSISLSRGNTKNTPPRALTTANVGRSQPTHVESGGIPPRQLGHPLASLCTYRRVAPSTLRRGARVRRPADVVDEIPSISHCLLFFFTARAPTSRRVGRNGSPATAPQRQATTESQESAPGDFSSAVVGACVEGRRPQILLAPPALTWWKTGLERPTSRADGTAVSLQQILTVECAAGPQLPAPVASPAWFPLPWHRPRGSCGLGGPTTTVRGSCWLGTTRRS